MEFKPVWIAKVYSKGFNLLDAQVVPYGTDKDGMSEITSKMLEETNGEYVELVTAYSKI